MPNNLDTGSLNTSYSKKLYIESTIDGMYSIPSNKRIIGMLISVQENGLLYKWDGTNFNDLSKEDVALSNVDNTADINKPISTATQTALDSKLDNGFTISQLRLLSDEQVTITLLFYCSEAGKEGFWKYNASNTTGVDNLGTLLVTIGGKRLERVVGDNILFQWFEVNAETDHSSALNNAVLASKLLQKPLILKSNSLITVNQKFELYQSLIGNNSTIYLKNNSTIVNGNSILVIMNHNITVSGIILDGNNANNIGTATDGVLGIIAYQKKYLTIDNVKIINTRNRALTILNCPNFKFTNSIVDSCGRYISQMPSPQADRISVLIDNNVATKGTEFYMGLESYIDNIKITNSGLDGLVLGVGMNVLNSTFSYNGQDLLNYYAGGAGIYTRPPQNYNNGEIDGLNIINCNTHWNTGLGIDIGSNAFSTNNPITKNITIQNCKVSNNNSEGIGIGSNQDVSILGNFCWDNGVMAFYFDGNVNSRRSGIGLNSVPMVNDQTSYFPTKNILIENNTCYDSRDVIANKTQQYGIYIDNNHELAESENFIIKNNHLARNAQKAILLPYYKRPVKQGSVFYFNDNTAENSFTIIPQDNTLLTPINPHIYLNPSTNLSIIGIDASILNTIISIENVSNKNITLVHSATFKLLGNSNIVLTQNKTAKFMYCFETGAFCWKQINTGNEIISKLLSTSNVFLANQAIGITAEATTNLRVDANVGGSTIATGVWSRGTIQTDVTTSAYYFRTATRTANNLSIGSIVHYIASQGTLGSNNIIEEQVGFYVDSSLLAGNANIAFKSAIPSGVNNWGIYNGGTAKSYFGGNVLIGSTTDSGDKIQVTGTAKIHHLKGGTSTPTISAGTGAGTSPTVSITGSDLCGTITITTGTSPLANAVLATINFNIVYSVAPIVIIKEANANAVGVNTVYVPANGQINGTTTIAFNLTTGAIELSASTTYMYYYQVMQ